MKFVFFQKALLLFFLFLTIFACNEDDGADVQRIVIGSPISIACTYQSISHTANVETDIEDVLMMPAGTFMLQATVDEAQIEFTNYLNIYDINFTGNDLDFTIVSNISNPAIPDYFKVLEDGNSYRFYFTFGQPQLFSSVTSFDEGIEADYFDRQLSIKISAGYDLSKGFSLSFS